MHEKFEQYKRLAERALNEGGQNHLLEAVRGVGYAVLALAETQEMGQTVPLEPFAMGVMAMPPVMEKVEGSLGHFEEEAFIHPTVEMDGEELARRILRAQLEDGTASVPWEDRGPSRETRVRVASVILDGVRERMVRHTIAQAVAATLAHGRLPDVRESTAYMTEQLERAYQILEVAERVLTSEPVEVPEVAEAPAGKDWRDEEGMQPEPVEEGKEYAGTEPE